MKLFHGTMQAGHAVTKTEPLFKKREELLNIVPNPQKRLKVGHGEEGNSK